MEKDMKATLKSLICQILAVALMMMPFQYGQAGMIGTDQANAAVSAQSQSNTDRSLVLEFLSRSQTASELQKQGMDPEAARQRVAAMTDSEVAELAGHVNSLPAGADSGALVIVLVVFIIWWFAFRR
jgi:hypothetical protein